MTTSGDRRWLPEKATRQTGRPNVDQLIAYTHTVFRVTGVTDRDLADSDADTEVWMQAGCPDVATWRGRPCHVDVEYVGGVRPESRPGHVPADGKYRFALRATRYGTSLYVYPDSGRWPSCGCCGEPMPCRAELEDRAVAAATRELEKRTSRMPGCCWACGEPVTSRQQAVTYRGENLDLPGGPTVTFHLRRSCWGSAIAYELRWIGVDPRRERILTYPECGGQLVVHGDGSSECRQWRVHSAYLSPQADGCRGHTTHDHGSMTACYVDGSCPRGCSPTNHPGTRHASRPVRRDQGSLTLDGA